MTTAAVAVIQFPAVLVDEISQTWTLFGPDRETVLFRAWEDWVLPALQPGGWIYEMDREMGRRYGLGALIQDLVARGRVEEAIRQVWPEHGEVYFEVFDGSWDAPRAHLTRLPGKRARRSS